MNKSNPIPIPRVNLITTCTKGKHSLSNAQPPQVEINQGDTVNDVIYRWREKLQLSIQNGKPAPAEQVYRGTHWETAKQIARENERVDLWVISAGMGLLHANESIVPYEASFNSLHLSGREWWSALTGCFTKGRAASSIQRLMQDRPHEIFVIAGSPVYISAVECDVLAGTTALDKPNTQLIVVTSGGYTGCLSSYVKRSHAGMLNALNSNMVCLNIKYAAKIVTGILSRIC